MELVVASANIHKVRELRFFLKSLGWDVLSLRDFPAYRAPEEIGDTFEENAISKARCAALALHRWVLADDSGLVVPALQGAPGVYSSRYAGSVATDMENVKKLLLDMAMLEELDRFAYFSCCIAIASPEGETKVFHGKCEGYIIKEPRGRYGFGYDCVFRKHDYNKTFAELDEELKGKISHRRKALDRALMFLESVKEHAVLG